MTEKQGLHQFIEKLLSIGFQNKVNTHRAVVTLFDIQLLNIINYYYILCATTLYLVTYYLGSSSQFIFLVSGLSAIVYPFFLVSGGILYAKRLILFTPLVSLISVNALYEWHLFGITSILSLGLFIIFIFFLLFFWRKKGKLVLSFFSISAIATFLGTSIINQLIFNIDDTSKILYTMNHWGDYTLKPVEHTLSFLLCLGLFIILYFGKKHTLRFYSISIKKINNIRALFEEKREKYIQEEKALKQDSMLLQQLEIKQLKMSTLDIIDEILYKKGESIDILDDISRIIQNFFASSHIIIYQKNNMDNYQVLTHFSNHIKKQDFSTTFEPHPAILEAERKKKIVILYHIPSNYFSKMEIVKHLNNQLIYICPIIKGSKILAFMEFSVSNPLKELESKILNRILVLLTGFFQHHQDSKKIASYKKVLQQIDNSVSINSH